MKKQIRKIHFITGAVILSSFITASGHAHAEDSAEDIGSVFAGIKYANQGIDMHTQFIRRTSGLITEQSTFNNNYIANTGGLFVGYTRPYGKFYVSSQVFIDVSNGDFNLSFGSSRFTNTMNRAFGIELMPGAYLFEDLSVFGKIGLVSGNFDFVKDSPTSTTYDANSNLYGHTLGFGVAYDVTSKFTAKVGYSQTTYGESEINATLGTRTDKTIVEPQIESMFLTLQYNLN